MKSKEEKVVTKSESEKLKMFTAVESTIVENLGSVDVILTDKTGTLT